MAEIQWQFVLGDGLVSWGISLFSAGHLSHVDAIVPAKSYWAKGYLFGARDEWHENVAPGLRARPPDYETWKRRVVFTLPVSVKQKQDFWAFQYSQEGHSYDSWDVWGFVFGRDWNRPGKWMCSADQAAATMSADITRPLYSPAQKITPVAWANILSALGATWGELPV
jgi:hypothetical protein